MQLLLVKIYNTYIKYNIYIKYEAHLEVIILIINFWLTLSEMMNEKWYVDFSLVRSSLYLIIFNFFHLYILKYFSYYVFY